MYVTAQRVRSSQGEVGINAFLYLHGTDGIPDGDVEDLVEKPPGSRRHQLVSVGPGGNAVDSYLDVVAPDGVGEDELRTFLQDCAAALPEQPKSAHPVRRERTWNSDDGNFVARFNWSSRIPRTAGDELSQLAVRVLALIEDFRTSGRGRAQNPLEIYATRHEDHTTLVLSPESIERLEDEIGQQGFSDRVTIDHDTLVAFQQIHGRFWPHAAELLISVEPDVLERMGGVRVIDGDSKRVLWKSFSA